MSYAMIMEYAIVILILLVVNVMNVLLAIVTFPYVEVNAKLF